MELVVTQLVFHKYSLVDLESNCTPNILKDSNLNVDWNEESIKSHPYIDEIKQYDIAISATWYGREEVYAYFFFKKEQLQNCVKYDFMKAIIDNEMPNEYLMQLIEQVIRLLNNGNFLVNDRLVYNDYPYPLVYHHLESTIQSVSQNLIQRFEAETKGITPLPNSLISKRR